MKLFKYIVFFALFLNTTSIVSQNKKVIPPPPITNPAPQAHFSWTNACFGDSTCFYNQSILCDTYTWTVMWDTVNIFGFPIKDSVNAYDDSVMCYHFDKIGTFWVTLNCYDNHWSKITQVISIDSLMSLSFYYFGCRDVFVNQSTCVDSFLWHFGDGYSSNAVSPIHEYADTGSYNVTLIGYNGIKSDTLTQQIHLLSVGFANPAFTYTVSHDTVFVHGVESAPNNLFYWTWQDGTYSSGQDTFHVYKDSTAQYVVTLLVVNGVCGPFVPGSHDTVNISQQPPPLPNFSFINTCLGDSTCFINQTIGGITYTWTVHDTNFFSPPLFTSNNSSGACYRFPSVGNYSVTLTTNDNFYTESITQVITIGTIPIADFSFIHCSNNFANNSSCATSFYWDFGDGTHSNLFIPTHQYADTGYYQVTLTAYNANDSNKLTQQIHVDVTSAPNANFTTISSNDTLWLSASYVGVPNATYNWSFGDGVNGIGKNTLHVYADTVKTYYVKLSVSNVCGLVSITDTVKITVPLPPPDLDFSNSILTIVPNPVSSSGYIDAFFNAYSSDDYLTQVYNAIGQKMFEEYFSFEPGINEFKISTVNFASGVYIMVIQSGNSYIRRKFYVINTP
jgi:PKD repeat protein